MPLFSVAADTGNKNAGAGKLASIGAPMAGVPRNRMPERKKRIRGGYSSRV